MRLILSLLVPDENHMTVPPAFLARALRFALPRQP
jgi:hypothetical protein